MMSNNSGLEDKDVLADSMKALTLDEKHNEAVDALITPPTTVTTKNYSCNGSTSSMSVEKCDAHSVGLKNSESGSLFKLIDQEIARAPISKSISEEKSGDAGDFSRDDLTIFRPRPFDNNGGDFQLRDQFQRCYREAKVTLSETLIVPVKMYPKYNFVGRILGPRGMTVKQLERETGCKIFVRGRASNLAFNPHTKVLRGGVISNKSSLSTISQSALTDEPLHVYIECHDFPGPANQKMENAISIIKELLSPPADGKDELKRQQLVDISLINGTYRPTTASSKPIHPPRNGNYRKSYQTVDPTSNPAEIDGFAKDKQQSSGSIYRLPQQKRSWHKPRGPDSNTAEFAKSVSSREYVTDIVKKTKEVVRNIFNDNPTDGDDLAESSAVSESLKIAKKLLESHNDIELSKVPSTAFGSMDRGHQQAPMPYIFPFYQPMIPSLSSMPDYSPSSYIYPPPPPPPEYMFPPPPQPQFYQNHQTSFHHYQPENMQPQFSGMYFMPGLPMAATW